MSIIFVIAIAVSLSMDAFSLSLAYGTLNISIKERYLLSIIVGIYHFIMPLLGSFFGSKILSFIPISPNVIVFLVLLIIGIQMIIETFKEGDNIKELKTYEMIIFGFAVSIDSFSVGIGLKAIYDKIIISALLFSLSSFLFTNLGIFLGTKIHLYVGKISMILGGITLIIVGIIYLL